MCFSHLKDDQYYLDEVVLLGSVLVKKASGCRCRNKQDGLKGDLSFSGEVNVRHGLIRVLKMKMIALDLIQEAIEDKS